MERSIPLLSDARFRQYRRTGCADHDDVQPHGRASSLALERPIREDHGVLSHASRSRSAAVGHLCWLLETQTCGRRSRGPYLHSAWRGTHDRAELVVRSVRQPPASEQCSLRFEACRTRHYWRGDSQTWSSIDSKRSARDIADRRICRDAVCRHQLSVDPYFGWFL